MTRETAITKGLKHYSGHCKKHGKGKRYTSNGCCVLCINEATKARQESIKARIAAVKAVKHED